MLSALGGQSDIAVGNVVGSNLFNVFVILGVCALIRPLALSRSNIRRDIPFGFVASLLLFLFASDRLLHLGTVDRIDRTDGIVMLVLYIGLLWFTVKTAGRSVAGALRQARQSLVAHACVHRRRIGRAGRRRRAVPPPRHRHRPQAGRQRIGHRHHARCRRHFAARAGFVGRFGRQGQGRARVGQRAGVQHRQHPADSRRQRHYPALTMGGITTLDVSMVVLSSLLLFLTAFTFRRKTVDRWEGAIFSWLSTQPISGI